jgi:predicted TPR repeat methyltransferase
MQDDPNQKTIQSYEARVQEYIDVSIQEIEEGVLKDWMDEFLKDMPKAAHILELGSAFGRDADYLQQQGYNVECTDAAQGFVEVLHRKGFQTHLLNAITDDLGGPYDVIFANAVLLHFTRRETEQVVQKAYQALSKHGTFDITLKEGEGEQWTDPATDKLGITRYICFWTEDQIREVMTKAGFSEVKVADGLSTVRASWLQVIAKK